MNVLQSLIVYYNSLPLDNTYRLIAQEILCHLDQIPNMNVYEIADMAACSRTTIWRMAQKLGYRSFSEFHHALREAVEQYNYYNRLIPWEKAQSLEGIISGFAEELYATAGELKHMAENPATISRIVQLLHGADKVAFYLQMQAQNVNYLQENLSITGKRTSKFSLHPDIQEDTETLTEQSVVFVTTLEHVEVRSMDTILRRIRQKGSTIIMGSGPCAKYKQVVDYFLFPDYQSRSGLRSLFENTMLVLSEEYRRKYI